MTCTLMAAATNLEKAVLDWAFQWCWVSPQADGVGDKICMMLTWTKGPRYRRQHTVPIASIVKVCYSTQTQRDTRMSWQLLLLYLCWWANGFIFRPAAQITPHFTPAPKMWIWTMPMNKRACIYLHIVKERKKKKKSRKVHCLSGWLS